MRKTLFLLFISIILCCGCSTNDTNSILEGGSLTKVSSFSVKFTDGNSVDINSSKVLSVNNAYKNELDSLIQNEFFVEKQFNRSLDDIKKCFDIHNEFISQMEDEVPLPITGNVIENVELGPILEVEDQIHLLLEVGHKAGVLSQRLLSYYELLKNLPQSSLLLHEVKNVKLNV